MCFAAPGDESAAAAASPLASVLSAVRVLPRRLSLDTPGVMATVPMLRGVWGAALHRLDPIAYDAVFDGVGPPHVRQPAYVLRPARPDPADAPAVEWILFGPAIRHDEALLRAWDVASGMGLGSERIGFRLKARRGLGSHGRLDDPGSRAGWTLDRAAWPLTGNPASTPCRLAFAAPLRLMRDGELIVGPAPADLALAACRRLAAFLPEDLRDVVRDVRRKMLEEARALPAMPWKGQRLDLVRYSGRQRREVEQRGVAGYIDLPEGPGPLWPLFAAAQWLHLGKGTVHGLGQLVVKPIGDDAHDGS